MRPTCVSSGLRHFAEASDARAQSKIPTAVAVGVAVVVVVAVADGVAVVVGVVAADGVAVGVGVGVKMNILRGKSFPPARMVVYGPSGVGKSTFACSAPDVLALDYEDGLSEIGPARVKGASTWTESMELVREACAGPGDHRTIVVDTIDRLEDQATEHVCKVGVKGKSLPDLAAFGYGDGFEALAAQWRQLLFALESARPKGREVILVGHVQQKTQSDPTMEKNYDKYVAALSKRCWGVTHRWADAVLYATYEAGMIEGRAIMTGARMLHTVAGTGFDAKNRWSLPNVLPLSWEEFSRHRTSLARQPEEVIASIRALLTDATREKAEDYISKANGDVPRLVGIEKALKKKDGVIS